MAALLGALQYFANAHNINKKDILPSRRGLVVSVYSVHQERTLTRGNPKRGYALKGLYILAQGNALGDTETNASALKGRDIGYTLMCD
jgi:hypothetical protein